MKKQELKNLIKQIIRQNINNIDYDDKDSVKKYLQDNYQFKVSALYTKFLFDIYIDLQKQKQIYNGDYEIVIGTRIKLRKQLLQMLKNKYEYYFDIRISELASYSQSTVIYLSHQDLTILLICNIDLPYGGQY